MKDSGKRELPSGIALLAAFVVLTVMIRHIDVRKAGPNTTEIGFAAFNVWFHRLTGVHMMMFTITDWLGLVPAAVCICFGILGLVQWVQRRRLLMVDTDILLSGAYYLLVILCYLLFEMVPVNYRPVLIEGRMEASYPSSTTLLVLSVMPTLKLMVDRRIGGVMPRKAVTVFVIVFSSCMTVGRLVSGVHWATDIAGSVLISSGLFLIYRYLVVRIGGTAAGWKPEGSSGVR